MIIPDFVLYAVIALAGIAVGFFGNRIVKRSYLRSAMRRTREAQFRAIEKLRETLPTPAFLAPLPESAFTVERIAIENFKNIQRLELRLMENSSLEGNWTCIAGINGAGKSAILQALCVVLLGERLAPELGSTRLRRLIRRTPQGPLPGAKIEAWISRGTGSPVRIALYLNSEGVDEIAIRSDPDYLQMSHVWQEMKSLVLVSYGATRNLSQEEEKRHDSKAKQVQRQMTLFDPLTRIADVDVLVKSDPGNEKKRRTLQRLLEKVIDKEELGVSSDGDRIVFGRTGMEVEAIDLPDGFRSTVAWLADLCASWHDTAPKGFDRGTDPSQIAGIVLLDEIDLHLHPSMARSIVPKLRKALPRVQFVVTTHSPLVLSSFDRAELIMLEADAEGLVESRLVDRQVFAFSMDEIFKWLMRTPPQSTVIEEKVARGDDRNVASYFYQAGETSQGHRGVNESDAQLLVDDLERLLEEVKERRSTGEEASKAES